MPYQVLFILPIPHNHHFDDLIQARGFKYLCDDAQIYSSSPILFPRTLHSFIQLPPLLGFVLGISHLHVQNQTSDLYFMPPRIFPIPVNGNFIFPVAQVKNLVSKKKKNQYHIFDTKLIIGKLYGLYLNYVHPLLTTSTTITLSRKPLFPTLSLYS